MDNSKPVVTQMVLAKLMEAKHKGMDVGKGFCGEWVLSGVGRTLREGEVYKTLKEQI